jgi:ATP synthase protein I
MIGLRVKTAPGKIVVGQTVVALICVVLWIFLGGMQAGIGALLGGGISVFLSLYFAIKMFSVDAAADPRGAVSAFFKAEAVKLVLAAVFFSLAAKYLAHLFLPLISTFIATLAVYWLALIFTRLDPAGFGR